ncbi:MAG: metal ABC transporter ATP-binding protein [Erysipelothrix sp.]|nr:metal ABC transporter ATP-binding protein [Erysipelothrix sp.]
MENKLLSVIDLSFKYGKLPILKNLNFEIESGDYLGIIGPNGSGKTTLIKVLLRLLSPQIGEVIYHQDIIEDNALGYVPQKTFENHQNFPATVKEIVRTGLLANKGHFKFYTKADDKKVVEILDRLKISDLKNRKIGELSGGQQQRVLLARSLVSNPKLLILDEPTSALDPEIREDFYNVLTEINKDGVSIILISHDLSAIESYVNKILYLDRQIMFFGNTCDFRDSDAYRKYHGHIH